MKRLGRLRGLPKAFTDPLYPDGRSLPKIQRVSYVSVFNHDFSSTRAPNLVVVLVDISGQLQTQKWPSFH